MDGISIVLSFVDNFFCDKIGTFYKKEKVTAAGISVIFISLSRDSTYSKSPYILFVEHLNLLKWWFMDINKGFFNNYYVLELLYYYSAAQNDPNSLDYIQTSILPSYDKYYSTMEFPPFKKDCKLLIAKYCGFAEGNHLSFIISHWEKDKYLSTDVLFNKTFIEKVIANDGLNILEWLRKNFPASFYACDFLYYIAGEFNKLQILDWLVFNRSTRPKRRSRFYYQPRELIVGEDRTDILEWFFVRGFELFNVQDSLSPQEVAKSCKNTKILQWLKEREF